MPSLRDLRRRIKSIKSTAQITKAMQMVAASKMRRAQQAALAGRPYAQVMNEVLAALSGRLEDVVHPLLQERAVRKSGVLVISSDKGLAGALNTNLLREAARFETATTTFITAGRKGSQFVARTKRNLLADFPISDSPKYAEARNVGRFLIDKFINGEVDQVDVLFTDFVSTLTQKPAVRRILPISKLGAVQAGLTEDSVAEELPGGATEFKFEPDVIGVLEALLPQFVQFQIYQMMLEAKASEHSARMVAMKNATDNAKQLIKDLTLEYNKARQANITKELLEITSAAMAMD